MMAAGDDHGDYEVGYGKPPKSGQFKKGQSGNPSGKKKPPKVEDIIAKALAKSVAVTVGGKKQNLSTLELIVETLVRKAASGELAAIKLMLGLAQAFVGDDPEEPPPLTDHQLALLQDIVALATFLFLREGLRGGNWRTAYERYRANLGRGILLGLELLVGADIIGTITAPLTFESVGLLAVIVLIRTFLSFALETEIEGCWPWERGRRRGGEDQQSLR